MTVRIRKSRPGALLLLLVACILIHFEKATAEDKTTATEGATGPDDISALLESIRKEHGLPALGAAIIEGEDLVAIGVTGLRKLGGAEEVAASDRWHLGSCGKAMTATLIARLVEKRRLSWRTTIGQAFPKLRKSMRPEYRDVTLEQLLSHHGGITGDLAEGHPDLWRKLRFLSGAPRHARNLLVKELLKTAPVAQPGKKYVYSNAGYTIAGAIAEQATGKSWEELMQREVFGPLGMRSAGFGAPKGDAPWGHREPSRGGQPVAPGPLADNPSAIGPAGTIHCSLEDWARFVALHVSGVAGKQKKFLSESSLEKLHTPVADSEYALGWLTAERSWGGGTVLTHAGSNTMWRAVVWAAPERDFAILVTTNQGGQSGACDDAVEALLKYRRERD